MTAPLVEGAEDALKVTAAGDAVPPAEAVGAAGEAVGEEEMVDGALNVPLEVGLERTEKVPAAAPPGVRVPAAGSEGDGVGDWAAGEGDVVAEGPCPVLVAKEDTVGAEVSVGAKV